MQVYLGKCIEWFHGKSIGQTRQNNLKSTKCVGGQHKFAHYFSGAPCQAEKKILVTFVSYHENLKIFADNLKRKF